MLKKISCITLALVVAMSLYSCKGGGKYAEVIDFMNGMFDTMETFADDLKAAKDGDKVADVLDKFTDDMTKIQKDFKELREKYPELDKKGAEAPPELKDVKKRQEEVIKKMKGSFGIVMKHMKNKKVMKALQRMGKVLRNFNMK